MMIRSFMDWIEKFNFFFDYEHVTHEIIHISIEYIFPNESFSSRLKRDTLEHIYDSVSSNNLDVLVFATNTRLKNATFVE